MSTTLEQLEQRVAELETEVSRLRLASERRGPGRREADPAQEQFAAGWAKALEQLGIRGKPIGAEKVQQMIAACGFKPEDNEFSRGIIEAREE
jgi:hypothetical protein